MEMQPTTNFGTNTPANAFRCVMRGAHYSAASSVAAPLPYAVASSDAVPLPYSAALSDWWSMVTLEAFEWNDNKGPFGKSFDLLGDGSIQLINIPGHADGLFAVKATNAEGKFVLLFSDGGYATKSWQEQITSGIAADKEKQKTSLAWIREQSLDPLCAESLANHDPDVKPHVIEL